MTTAERFRNLAQNTARFLARPPQESISPTPLCPPGGATSTGGARKLRSASGSCSRRAHDVVRVISDATLASLGATPQERQEVLRADLEASSRATKAGIEAEEAKTIQAEFGFDELEPLPRGVAELPDYIIADQEQGLPRAARPYYLRED